MRWIMVLFGAALLAGCGSGGGGGGSVSGGSVALDFSTQAPSVQTVLNAVQFTVQLPAGVTVQADATGTVNADQLQLKVSATEAAAHYTAATATQPATVVVNIAAVAGFAPGALATLLCHDGSGGGGSYPVSGVKAYSASDQDSVVAVDGVAVGVSPRRL